MRKGINLSLVKKSKGKLLRKSFVASASLFCFTVVVSLSLIAYRLVLKGFYDSLETKEQQLNARLLTIQEQRDKFSETKKRIDDIKQIIAKRSPITSRIQTIGSAIPVDAQLETLNGDEEKLSFSIRSDSISSLNDLIERKIIDLATDKKKGIKKVEMSSFGLSPATSEYTVSMSVSFN